MQAWESFLLLQERELGVETVSRWLRSLKIRDYDAANLYLEAKDSFQITWFEEHIRTKLKTLLNNNGRSIKVHLKVFNGREKKESEEKGKVHKKSSLSLQLESFDPHYTFESMVVSDGNFLAHKIVYEMVDSYETSPHRSVFNPIYIYGDSATGKSHLISAAAQSLQLKGANVLYVRAETFTEHVVQAIRLGEMRAFREFYRSKDILVIDNVDAFSRKIATQEELFHTFNAMHMANKQIILAANCSPQQLSIEPRLTSRFEWGIVVPIYALEQNQHICMLQNKCLSMGIPLTTEVKKFLSESFFSPKAICAALQALVLRAYVEKNIRYEALTVPFVQQILKDLIEEQRDMLRPEKIVQVVADCYGICERELFEKNQRRELITPRQIAMFLCRYRLKMSFAKIGSYFCRDHSTVISAVRRVQKEIASGSALLLELNKITKKLQICLL